MSKKDSKQKRSNYTGPRVFRTSNMDTKLSKDRISNSIGNFTIKCTTHLSKILIDL